MRLLLAVLALAGSLLHVVPAQAQTDDRYAMMSAGDVVKAKRCAPPFGCKRQRPPQKVSFSLASIFGGSGGLADRAGRYVGTNPTGWARVWCGRFLRMVVPSDPGPAFDLARNWKNYGAPAGPVAGAIGVMPHHVGIVLGRCPDGSVLMRSGNHNHRVDDGCYAQRRFIAFRSA